MSDKRDSDQPQLHGLDDPEAELYAGDEIESAGVFDIDAEDPDSELAAGLDADIIDLSDEEIQREFAAMEAEAPATGQIEADRTGHVEPEISLDEEDLESSADQPGPDDNLAADAGVPDRRSDGDKSSIGMLYQRGLERMAELYESSPALFYGLTSALLLSFTLLILFLLFYSSPQPLADAEVPEAVMQAEAATAASVVRDPFDEAIQEAKQREESAAALDADTSENAAATTGAELTAESEAPQGTIDGSDSEVASVDPVTPLLAQIDADSQDLQPQVLETESATQSQPDTSTEAQQSSADLEQTAVMAPAADGASAGARSDAGEPALTEAETIVPEQAATTAGPYHVIVASFATEALAQQHLQGMNDEAAYLIPPFGSATNYRIAVAGYGSMAAARAAIAELRASYGDGIWPLRYPPQTPIPLVREATGATYLIVASFADETTARQHAEGLRSDGLTPTILAPFGQSSRYRVAARTYESLPAARGVLAELRERYGADAWLLQR